MWVEGGWGVSPTYVHMHKHTCTCRHAVVNMIISCKWPPPLEESLGIPYDVIHMCACMHVHACVCMCMCVGAPSHHPPHPPGGPLELFKIQ